LCEKKKIDLLAAKVEFQRQAKRAPPKQVVHRLETVLANVEKLHLTSSEKEVNAVKKDLAVSLSNTLFGSVFSEASLGFRYAETLGSLITSHRNQLNEREFCNMVKGKGRLSHKDADYELDIHSLCPCELGWTPALITNWKNYLFQDGRIKSPVAYERVS
jgi:hypothetical protein